MEYMDITRNVVPPLKRQSIMQYLPVDCANLRSGSTRQCLYGQGRLNSNDCIEKIELLRLSSGMSKKEGTPKLQMES